MRSYRALVFALLLIAPLAALAQNSYRCTAKDGKKYYGQSVPAQCVGVVVEELSPSGTVVKRVAVQASADDRAKKEAEEAERQKQAAINKEQARRDQALLATYTSEKEIDDARARAMAENTKSVQLVEGRIESIRQQQAGYEKDAAQYKGKGDLPASLQQDLKTAEADLKAQQELLEIKKRESEAINARYDDDKKRYSAITRQR